MLVMMNVLLIDLLSYSDYTDLMYWKRYLLLRKAPSKMFDRALNTPLKYAHLFILFKISLWEWYGLKSNVGLEVGFFVELYKEGFHSLFLKCLMFVTCLKCLMFETFFFALLLTFNIRGQNVKKASCPNLLV